MHVHFYIDSNKFYIDYDHPSVHLLVGAFTTLGFQTYQKHIICDKCL